MKNQKTDLKIAFIYVTYKESEKMKSNIKNEIEDLGFNNLKIYHIDNLKDNIGYAAGVNKGIIQGLKDGREVFIISNPDISLKNLKAEDFYRLIKRFDIGGFGVEQDNKIYYGGEIDKWRMSGGLTVEKPNKRFVQRDFVSGSLMVIKKKVIDGIGFFAESYFLYYEEVDYCFRAKKAGFLTGVDSLKTYRHFEVSKENREKEKYLAASRLKFLIKYGNFQQKLYELARTPKTFLEFILKKANLNLKKGFLINFFSLNFSSLIGKILNFILFIFLIRFLNAEEYGIYTLIWAQISIFSPLVDLGTTTYGIVNLPVEEENKFQTIFNLRIFASIIIFMVTLLVSIVFFRSNIKLLTYILLTSFVIFSNMFSGTYLIKSAVNNRLYDSSIVSLVFNVFLIFSLIISLIYFRSLKIVFLLIFIFYNFYSLINYFLIRKDLTQFKIKIDIVSWMKLIKKSYIFIVIGFLAGLYFKLDVFLLQILKGSKEVGIYSAGYKYFEALIFVAASYNIARTPILAKVFKSDKKLFSAIVKKDFIYLLLFGLSIVLAGEYLGPIILPYFMKGNYLESITVLKIVIIGLPFILVSSILLNILYILQKAYLVIFVFLFQTIVNFVLNYSLIPKYSYFASSYITVLSEALNFAILLLLIVKIKKNYENIN